MKSVRILGLLLAGCVAAAGPAHAQDYGADSVSGDRGDPSYGNGAAEGGRNVVVQPYIEASQIFQAELSPGDTTVTYTQIAAGVDTTIAGRNNGASVSLRYERNIGYGSDTVDSDTLSGIARGYATIVPQEITVEAGALASRTRVDGSGGTSINPQVTDNAESRIYSVYAGPNLHARLGDVQANANGRIGYTRVESPDTIALTPGSGQLDVFDESTTYSANAHLAVKPGEPLPVGVGVGAGYNQEDISNLDQRIRDVHVRADVTVPVSPTLAVVGGVGYEDVEISSRDAVRDTNGVPLIGDDGRYVTDTSQPRQLAYDVSGLIWDVGVVWRPSRRTALEAHVGRRYDSTTYYGSFGWAPDSRSKVNVSVYDGVSGFGGVLTNSLAALPTEFSATRNALTGDFNGCVSGDEGASCVGGVFGSIRSAAFRSRGVQASFSRKVGRYDTGFAAGYDRRKFIAAPGTVLASADGLVDESYYVSAFLSGELGQRAGFTVNSYINWFTSDFANGGDVTAIGTSAAYRHALTGKLSARAAVALDYLDTDVTDEDIKTATALLGLRYDF